MSKQFVAWHRKKLQGVSPPSQHEDKYQDSQQHEYEAASADPERQGLAQLLRIEEEQSNTMMSVQMIRGCTVLYLHNVSAKLRCLELTRNSCLP